MWFICYCVLIVACFGIGALVVGIIGGLLLSAFLVVLGLGIKHPKKYAIYTCSFFSFIGLSLYLIAHPNLVHLGILKIQNSVFLTNIALAVTIIVILIAVYSTLKLTKGLWNGDF